ncbi:hypothetical protein GCM10011534_16080 [Pseudooceanicola nanhaiensis]|jgi:hypothetical protein|uniref:Uncharacterized protein n=1 Tax=Pseudooceanicola nanhaiensis TaxID=375761 RepID=A0A917SSZ8_9RHOB|nr:hypothetical protein GCM10011534_16080 [Pseudooceanicola nanhaiensis]
MASGYNLLNLKENTEPLCKMVNPGGRSVHGCGAIPAAGPRGKALAALTLGLMQGVSALT